MKRLWLVAVEALEEDMGGLDLRLEWTGDGTAKMAEVPQPPPPGTRLADGAPEIGAPLDDAALDWTGWRTGDRVAATEGHTFRLTDMAGGRRTWLDETIGSGGACPRDHVDVRDVRRYHGPLQLISWGKR